MVSSIGSSSDMQQLMALMMQKMGAADTDGAAGISKSELSSVTSGNDVGGAGFLSELNKNFDKIDTDGNGQLSGEEIGVAKPPQGPMGPPPGLQIESTEELDALGAVSNVNTATSASEAQSAEDTIWEKLLEALQESLANSFEDSSSSENPTVSKEGVSSLAETDTNARKTSFDSTALKDLTGSFVKQILSGYQDKLAGASSLLNLAV